MNAGPNARDKLLNDLSGTLAPTPEATAASLPAPPVIPDHELVRRIGRGSYGEVWLARNALGTWRAVKIVYRAAFDHDRPYDREFEGIRRFEPVSRTHPSQLNVLHVGRNDADGLFYYVMELADADQARGVESAELSVEREVAPTDEPSTANLQPSTFSPRTLRSELYHRGRFSFDECLQVGLALATALDHLHRHGLVHRDIKPSNIIFVNGIPKLADIGLVAHAEATLSLVGTEGYLPPEGPGTAQADIFSLGKVLYEMATGRDRQEFPELPTNLIQQPAAERAQLAELNEIIVRACHAELKQRYQTAAELHADLALLQSGKSVSRMRSVERRVRTLVRAGVLVTAIAVLAGTAFLYEQIQTRKARELARQNRRLAEQSRQVAQLLKDMLEGVGPAVALGRDTTLLRDIVDKTAVRIGRDLKDQPEVEAELATTLGQVYRDLENDEQSEAMLREALAIRQRLFGEHLLVADSLVELADTLLAYRNRAETEAWLRVLSPALATKLSEAESLCRQALAMRRKLRGHEHADVAVSLGSLARVLYEQRKLPEAEAIGREGLDLARKHLSNDDPDLATLLGNLAMVLGDVGKLQEAEALYREALPIKRRQLGETHPVLSTLLSNLGLVVERQYRLAEAEALYSEAVAIERKLNRTVPLDLARLLNQLSGVLSRQGKLVEAEAALREALPLKIKLYGEEHFEVAAVLDNLGGVLVDHEHLAEAEPLLEQGLAMRRKLGGDVHDHVAVSLTHLADLRERQSRLAEAESLLREAVEIDQKLTGDDRPYAPELAGGSHLVTILEHLSRVLQRQGKTAEASIALREALDLVRKPSSTGPPPATPTLGRILHHLADALGAGQAFAQARPLAEEAVGLYRLHPEWPANEGQHAIRVLINVLVNLNDLPAAEAFYREEIARQRSLLGTAHPDVAELLHDSAMLLGQSGKLAEATAAFREALACLRQAAKQSPDPESPLTGKVLHHLADALRRTGDAAEARRPAEEAVALYQHHPDWLWSESQHASMVLKDVLMDLGDFVAAEAVSRERLQNLRGSASPDSPELTGAVSELVLVLLAGEKFRDAEPLARECLESRKRNIPDDWRTFNSRSLLGGSLLGQKKYAEAGPLLLAGYEGMKQREDQIPAQGKPRLKEALQRLVQFCEETKPEQAAEWKQKLAELDQARDK
jgi:tetratricopeptide (TPR) repeat protein